MIPILYDYSETAFTSNGLGRLSDALRVEVTEERNGVFELEMDYPLTGIHFSEIKEGRIIGCTHDEDGDLQPFDIYASSKPINGVVTFYAHHISYRLNEIINRRNHTFVSILYTPSAAWRMFLDEPDGALDAWTFTSDIMTEKAFPFVPAPIRQLLGGMEGSMLDMYGGEFEFDKFNVRLKSARGENRGVHVRYRSNLTEYQEETNISESFNGIFPYWQEDTETGITFVHGDVQYGSGSLPHGRRVVVPYDFTDQFETQPTAAQLNAAASSMLSSKAPWLPSRTFDIDFVQLWQTEEYRDVAPLLTVKLCDTVLVSFPEYGITDMAVKVVKVVWDALADRYLSMELGTPSSTFAETVLSQTDQRQVDIETRVENISNLIVSTNARVTALEAGWTLAGSATGTGTVTAPETAKEVLVEVMNSTKAYRYTAVYPVEGQPSGVSMVGGYYFSTSDYGLCNVNVSNSGRTYQVRNFRYGGTDYKSTGIINLYYK